MDAFEASMCVFAEGRLTRSPWCLEKIQGPIWKSKDHLVMKGLSNKFNTVLALTNSETLTCFRFSIFRFSTLLLFAKYVRKIGW